MRTIGDWTRLNYPRNPSKEACVGKDGHGSFGEAAECGLRVAGKHRLARTCRFSNARNTRR
jgi:hypothetical protein